MTEWATISMAEYFSMMSAQQALLLGVVEVIRRQLVTHRIAISNLEERKLSI